MEMILSQKPLQRGCPLATISVSNVAFRLRGVSSSSSREVALQVLAGFPRCACFPGGGPQGGALVVEMITHLDFQGPAAHQDGFRQLFAKSPLPDDVFEFFVVSEQLIDQLFTISGS